MVCHSLSGKFKNLFQERNNMLEMELGIMVLETKDLVKFWNFLQGTGELELNGNETGRI